MALWAAACLVLAAPATAAEQKIKGGGTQTKMVHRIPIYDQPIFEGEDPMKITPTGEPPIMPMSTRNTCGQCHDYEKISSGWHFNAMDEKAPGGTPGEPWILADAKTGTQLPLSYRARPGVWNPADVGLTPWAFTGLFARHMPGGGTGGKYGVAVIDPNARWDVSGRLEINCLVCHSANPQQDQVQWFQQLGKQNYRWAATAAAGLATVKGTARKLPDGFDILMGDSPDAPVVAYDKSRFNDKGEVFFDIVRKPSANRCYACHSQTRPHTEGHDGKWKADEDIHMTGGLTCVDCHRNGMDHMISRGREGDAEATGHETTASLTCAGCHLGEHAEGDDSLGGRLGAPVPEHVGLPTVHLEKISCTACHSGPRPGAEALRDQTSRLHDLETHIKHHGPNVLPLVRSPVFVRQDDGKIGLHRAVWPAFWGRMKDDKVTPLLPKAVLDAGGKKALDDAKQWGRDEFWEPLKQEVIVEILGLLGEDKEAGTPVYVAGGKLHTAADGKLTGVEHDLAKPVTWAYAHNVRPASQALGAGPGQHGCLDCHTTDAGFFFGKVVADAPADVEMAEHEMVEFMELDGALMKQFNFTFVFRPYLKLTVFAASALVAAVLLWFGLRALGAVARWFADRKPASTENRE